MHPRPPVLTCEQARAFDREAVQRYGMPSVLLMENAGRGVVEAIVAAGFPGPAVICCGKGNNAGDGFVIARHLESRGYAVRMVLFAEPHELRGDAALNFEIVRRSGMDLIAAVGSQAVAADQWTSALCEAGVIVDALLGTGVSGAPRPPLDGAIDAMNAAGPPIVAVDLPSGLNADTGEVAGQAIRATLTCTFVAAKPGLLKKAARAYVGELKVVDIGAPAALVARFLPSKS